VVVVRRRWQHVERAGRGRTGGADEEFLMLATPRTDTATWSSRAIRAMGTDVLLLLEHEPDGAADAALDQAVAELHRLAAIFTRFDPTVHDALVAAGYDRTFAEVLAAPVASSEPPSRAGAGIAVDRATGIVALAAGASLDLGGIAKGWIADRIAEQLADLAPALVDAGGDIACTPRAGAATWRVDVPGADVRIELTAGGVASSGTDRRRWIDPASGEARHHLIDPATGACTTSDLDRVTTIAPTCADAEVASTSLLLAGSTSIDALADRLGVPYLARTVGGAWLDDGGIR
jgi:thiamine biosynthesis lipoprotein ApbE